MNSILSIINFSSW